MTLPRVHPDGVTVVLTLPDGASVALTRTEAKTLIADLGIAVEAVVRAEEMRDRGVRFVSLHGPDRGFLEWDGELVVVTPAGRRSPRIVVEWPRDVRVATARQIQIAHLWRGGDRTLCGELLGDRPARATARDCARCAGGGRG